MALRILDPASPDPSFSGLCALAVMAKAPRPGKVKTRLSPPLTLQQSAALNVCFLRDTATNLDSIPGSAGLVCYTPRGEEAAFLGIVPDRFALVPQAEGTFGQRLLAAAADILACGFESVCLIDSDSPTVPRAAFEQAVAALAEPGDRIVLGPSHDGGYYLIGLKAAHPEPFAGISWSTSAVAAETRERCRDAHLEVVDLPLWYDVDDQATLAVLERELLEGIPPAFTERSLSAYPAEATRSFLRTLAGSTGPLSQAAGQRELTSR